MNFNNCGIIVPDVSFYQDDNSTVQGIDFAKMKAAGVSGVIIRAGQNSWLDPDFKTNWQAAKAAGLPRGSYWFYDSRTEPAKQANQWHAAIGNDLPELGLWVDLEENYGGSYKEEKHYKQFTLAAGAYFPTVDIGIYTANWWWYDKVQRGIIKDDAFWSRYLLWVAQYGVNQSQVSVPRPWQNKQDKIVFWQYTASGDGAKYGVESREIDLNVFNGDPIAFLRFSSFAPAIPEIPTEPGETMSKWYKVTASRLNIRDEAGLTGDDVGDLLLGDIIEVSETIGTWHRIVKILRNGAPVACPPVAWCHTAYSIETTAPQPPAEVHPVSGTLTMSDGTKYSMTFTKVG